MDFCFILQPCKDCLGSHFFQFPNLGKTVSNIGLTSQFPILKMLFPMLDFHFTSTNLGNVLSNIGFFFTFTNLGWLKIDYQPWKTIKWPSSAGKCISFSNIGFPTEFPIIVQCFPRVFPMFFQFWNLTTFSCDHS